MAPGEFTEPTVAELKHAEANGRDTSALHGVRSENPSSVSEEIPHRKKRNMERVYIGIIVFLAVALVAVVVVFTVVNPMNSDDDAKETTTLPGGKSGNANGNRPTQPPVTSTTDSGMPAGNSNRGGPIFSNRGLLTGDMGVDITTEGSPEMANRAAPAGGPSSRTLLRGVPFMPPNEEPSSTAAPSEMGNRMLAPPSGANTRSLRRSMPEPEDPSNAAAPPEMGNRMLAPPSGANTRSLLRGMPVPEEPSSGEDNEGGVSTGPGSPLPPVAAEDLPDDNLGNDAKVSISGMEARLVSNSENNDGPPDNKWDDDFKGAPRGFPNTRNTERARGVPPA